MTTFGERLQELRKDAGLTQKQLGEKLNVSTSTITKWESQHFKAEPDIANLEAIADYFNVTLDYLRCRDDLVRLLTSVECYYKGVFAGQLQTILDGVSKLSPESQKDLLDYSKYLSEKHK